MYVTHRAGVRRAKRGRANRARIAGRSAARESDWQAMNQGSPITLIPGRGVGAATLQGARVTLILRLCTLPVPAVPPEFNGDGRGLRVEGHRVSARSDEGREVAGRSRSDDGLRTSQETACTTIGPMSWLTVLGARNGGGAVERRDGRPEVSTKLVKTSGLMVSPGPPVCCS